MIRIAWADPRPSTPFVPSFPVDAIVKKFGTQSALAEAIGADQSTIAHWKRRGVIPARQQVAIMSAAKRLGIEVSPADFFPAEQEDDAA